MTRKRKAIYAVEWEDAEFHEGWVHLNDFKADLKKTELTTSVGYLLHKTKRHIILAQTYTYRTYSDYVRIPRSIIRKMTKIA